MFMRFGITNVSEVDVGRWPGVPVDGRGGHGGARGAHPHTVPTGTIQVGLGVEEHLRSGISTAAYMRTVQANQHRNTSLRDFQRMVARGRKKAV